DTENAPLIVERGGAGEAGDRHRVAQLDGIVADKPRLDLGDLRAAVLLLRIGNAGERQRAFLRRLRQRNRLQSARAVNAQQRNAVVLVFGDLFGVADAGGNDHLTALCVATVGDDRTVRAYDQAGAVFDLARQ